ncbi:MmoB/DmpM family protein [Streptomyces sp. RB6PN25]|uniref:MmoB/DmpM family protein n=1 Tax=Streptomyces humicola TaxID=2953240 RepID=A0ABT1PN50_9ACTN|nr:MmoB/DmpM family protein [Streptomyces humicola]MCQ4079101.1 MmoB/DmpM family protein [Streptomyces humicola]
MTENADERRTLSQVIERGVGPVLQSTPLGKAIIAAIEEENEEVFVEDAGAYFRVFVPDECRVTREAIEGNYGRKIRFPGDLEVIMSSFAGVLSMSQDRAVWSLPPRHLSSSGA